MLEARTITKINQGKKAIRSFKDLEVYEEGFRLCMDIFKETQNFPQEERYSLISQLRNASRSIPANIAEGWAKRRHELVFKRHLLDAIGSANEVLVWLDIAKSCEYLDSKKHKDIYVEYEKLGRRLFKLHANWQTFK